MHGVPASVTRACRRFTHERTADLSGLAWRRESSWHTYAYLNTIVSGLTDHALLTLDEQGRARDWNSSVGRVTGRDSAATIGQSYSIFYPPGTLDPTGVVDRLFEADSTGWSLDEGWRRRADGSQFWGSCLIAPLHAVDEVHYDELERRMQAWPTGAHSSRPANWSWSAGAAHQDHCHW